MFLGLSSCSPGVEMRYDLYSPRMHEIQVLKLEKRLDSDLMYLRDALPEYSKIDVDMKPVMLLGSEIPVNTVSGEFVCEL